MFLQDVVKCHSLVIDIHTRSRRLTLTGIGVAAAGRKARRGAPATSIRIHQDESRAVRDAPHEPHERYGKPLDVRTAGFVAYGIVTIAVKPVVHRPQIAGIVRELRKRHRRQKILSEQIVELSLNVIRQSLLAAQRRSFRGMPAASVTISVRRRKISPATSVRRPFTSSRRSLKLASS